MAGDEMTGDDVERGYVPWADSLEGVSVADAERIKVLRISVLRALVSLPLVANECARWAPTLQAARQAALSSPERAVDIEALGLDLVAARFIKEQLRLNWVWLVPALIETVHRMIARSTDTLADALPPIGEYVVASPDVRFQVHHEDAIPIDDVIAEAESLVARLKQHKRDATKSGKGPRKDPAYLEGWARWLVEHRIGKREISDLARENHLAAGHRGRYPQDCDCRKQIYHGIAEAERLLSLGIQTF